MVFKWFVECKENEQGAIPVIRKGGSDKSFVRPGNLHDMQAAIQRAIKNEEYGGDPIMGGWQSQLEALLVAETDEQARLAVWVEVPRPAPDWLPPREPKPLRMFVRSYATWLPEV